MVRGKRLIVATIDSVLLFLLQKTFIEIIYRNLLVIIIMCMFGITVTHRNFENLTMIPNMHYFLQLCSFELLYYK